MRISQLAQQAGCEPETVRYYESLGLFGRGVASSDDIEYDDTDVERLRFIVRGVASGLGVEDVRRLLATRDHVLTAPAQRTRLDVPSGPLIRKGRLRSGQ